jgi:hypothetical protein
VELLLALAIVVAVAVFVTVPLRRREGEGPDPLEAERADLEAQRDLKYREIRDAEADHAAGKIGDAEFERQDRELRAEAIAILKRLDKLDSSAG